MQQIDRRIFKEGMLDSDSGSIYLPPSAWVNMRDLRIGSTDTVRGRVDYIQSVGSTVLKNNPNLPATGTNIVIGHAPDFPYKRIVFTVWNSLGAHCIFCYDLQADLVYTVLLNSQVTGGLNFDKSHPIHSAAVVNHCFYWTDNFNQPRRVDIDAGIKMNQPGYVTTTLPYTAPLDMSVITVIRRQPGIPPTCVKFNQIAPTVVGNFVANEAFQFCYRYVYRNFETGTLSGLSNLANFNSVTDMFNRIDVTLPLQEQILQDVIQVDLVAKYMVSGVYFVINSWFSNVPADAAAIAAHNAGTTALAYSFYNNKIGIALDTAYSVKPYDTVPLFCETIEAAKNRLFMANYTAGYNTPSGSTVSSLALTLVSGGSAPQVTGSWILFKFRSVCGSFPSTMTVYLLDIQNISPDPANGYYVYTPNGVPPFPASVNYAQCSYRGAGLIDVMNYYASGCTNSIMGFTPQGATSIITGAPAPPAVVSKRAFKSDAAYQYAITYYDYWGRKCGVVTNPSMQIQIPDRTYSTISFITQAAWTLSNVGAVNQIPDWAYYYSIDVTLCLRTRFFVQARSPQVVYATRDPSTNAWVFTSTTYAASNAGVAVDISLLASQGMGYVFDPDSGDILKLYTLAGNEYTLSIIDQVDQYLVCQLVDVGLGAGFKSLFEIYSPYQPSTDEPEYEINQFFPVNNPGQPSRIFSVTAGTINGDITLLSRNDGTETYLTENMSPNDKFYKLWLTDAGRPNFIDTIGQQTKVSTITWSSPFINGSKINGLSTFDALSTKDISPEYGSIMKLVLTNKIQRTGSIMLALCNAGETASLYLEENVVTTTTGETEIAQTSDVIGYVNNLRGSYGTLNPESVVEFRGNVYWFDALNGKYVQYSDSGLFPISNYKMTRYWKLFSSQYSSMTQAQIEAFGSRPYVFSGIDPHHGELLVSVPQVLAAPPMGNLVDYPSIPYPGDFWDGAAKSVVFKIISDPNKWTGAYRIKAEQYAYMDDNTYAFSGGNIYMCNSTESFGNFFGVQYTPDICLYSNANPQKPKEYNNLNLQANAAPIFTHLASEFPTIQSSIVPVWTELEGVFYGQILRDRLTPGYGTNYDDAMFRGDKIRSVALQIYLQWDTTTHQVQAKFCNATYNFSKGQVPA